MASPIVALVKHDITDTGACPPQGSQTRQIAALQNVSSVVVKGQVSTSREGQVSTSREGQVSTSRDFARRRRIATKVQHIPGPRLCRSHRSPDPQQRTISDKSRVWATGFQAHSERTPRSFEHPKGSYSPFTPGLQKPQRAEAITSKYIEVVETTLGS